MYQIVDILIAGASAAALWTAVTGGGVMRVAGVRVSATSPLTPLETALALAAFRAAFGPRRFLWIPALDIDTAARVAQDSWRRCRSRLSSLTSGGTAALVLAAAACSLGLKVYNAHVHFGFWTGDDVEIQEMTIGHLYRTGWPVWNLRCAFYPMVFIYPAQALLARAGVSDIRTLVFGSRIVVALWSTLDIWLTYRIAGSVSRSRAVGVIAAVVLAFSRLHVMAGSTELPRVVSTAFLLLAYALLQRRTGRTTSALLAGGALGIAGAMRFSEEVFLAAAAAQLIGEARWRDLVAVTAAFCVSALVVVGVSDWVYWGQPFSSLRHIVEYTLVQRQSSRGFQPFYEYALHLGAWSNLVIVVLAIVGLRAGPSGLAWWTWLPVAILSVLPHKEPRYLIPILPFVSMSAASGLWRVISAVAPDDSVTPDHSVAPDDGIAADGRGARWSAALVLLLAAALAWEAAGFRFVRSDAAVDLARYIGAQPGVDRVLVEQLWRMGGRLYFLRRTTAMDLDPSRAADDGYVRELLAGRPQWAAIDANDARPERALAAAGFHELRGVPEAAAARYRLFVRDGFTASPGEPVSRP